MTKVAADPANTGAIFITYNAANVGPIGATNMTFADALRRRRGRRSGAARRVVWPAGSHRFPGLGCASASFAMATGRGMGAVIPPATPMLAKFVPSECR